MKPTLRVLPASDGDCLVLSFGEAPRRHLLVDGGRKATYERLKPILKSIVDANEQLDLMVLSHIDADHIEGLLALAEDKKQTVPVGEIWFNGFEQLIKVKAQGIAQAEKFSAALLGRGWRPNERFGGRACVVPDGKPLPVECLDSGVRITLLSPDGGRLDKLQDEWSTWRTAPPTRSKPRPVAPGGLQVMGRSPMPKVLDVDALADGKEAIDDETPNGSSIAFVAEVGGRRVLFGADAHPDLLAASLERLIGTAESKYPCDVFKVSHHGSIGNTTRDLIKLLDCRRFVISSDGSRHGHPDPETIAKILKYGPRGTKTLVFNYRTDRTGPWDNPELKERWQYESRFLNTGDAFEIDS